jgi:HSP20 family protein
MMDGYSKNNSKRNLIETDDGYILEYSIPGYKEEEISVDIQDSGLIVKAIREKIPEENSSKYKIKNFSIEDEFYSVTELPKNIDTESIKATYSQGVLYIKMKRSKQESINIKVY